MLIAYWNQLGRRLIGVGFIGENLPGRICETSCVGAEPGNMNAGINAGTDNSVLVVSSNASYPVNGTEPSLPRSRQYSGGLGQVLKAFSM